MCCALTATCEVGANRFISSRSGSLLSGLLYLAGCWPVRSSTSGSCDPVHAPIGFLPAWRAYIVSHLGKYVPGKAMVVVVRSGMVVPFGGRASTAAIATFYETLVMMAPAAWSRRPGSRAALDRTRSSSPCWGWGRSSSRSTDWLRFRARAGPGVSDRGVPPVFGRLAGLVTLPIPGVGP